MIREHVSVNPDVKLPMGSCVCVDHSVETFTIQIRSMGTCGVDTLKNLIEQRFEVVSIEQTKETAYCHPGGAITAMRN